MMFVGLVAAQANDLDAVKYFNLGLSSSLASTKIKYFTQALMLNPKMVDAYEERGVLYFFQEKYDKVIQDFQKYLELAPEKAKGYRMLGLGFLKSRDYDRAIVNLSRAIQMMPDDTCAYANRAEAYRRIGKYDEAIYDATTAITIGGNLQTISDAYRTRAKAYLKTGRDAEVDADLNKAMLLDPRIAKWYKKDSNVLKHISLMGLFVFNGMLFLFLFEFSPHLLPRVKSRRQILLNSKLLIPQTADAIYRARLNPLLRKMLQKRVTTVIAGAGYGKTTLMAQAAKQLNLNTVWYRLDTTDSNGIVFLSYLIAGIRKHFPGFGSETFRRLVKRPKIGQDLEDALFVFIKELETVVQKELAIVLDDYHTVQYSREIKKSLEFLLERLPPSVHLILISRHDVGLPLSRLRVGREVLDMSWQDLAFTPGEIEQLFSQVFRIPLQPPTLKILHRKSEGWAAGLILFYHALRGKNPSEIEKRLIKLKGFRTSIFKYLEENVYDSLPDDKKDFVVKTSILPLMNAEFCDNYLKINNSRGILKYLEANQLFTTAYDEEGQWYAFHQLFRDFLQTKLRTELDSQVALEYHQHATVLLENFNNNPTLFSPHNIDLTPGEPAFGLPNEAQPTQAPALKVYFFGKFRMLQGRLEIPNKSWKSKKAQMLLKYLLCSRHKGYLKKDVCMELLWPEDDPAKTSKRFHVALASLRKTLEPKKPRGIPSAYILRSGDAYQIDIGDEGWVDIDRFKDELQLAQKAQDTELALQHYLNAAALYQGDFLEEDLYVAWCDEKRDRFKEDYLYVLTQIMQCYEDRQDYAACIDYAGRYLKVEKYDEALYQKLMQYYALTGNKALVIRIFERCKENILNGLDIPLSRKTEALFQELIALNSTKNRR